MAEYKKEYYKENKNEIVEYKKEYYKENKNEILKHNKEYKELNKDKLNNLKRDWVKNQMNNNPIYRLIKNNRARVHTALKSNNKTAHSIDLLGCTKEFFFNWIKWQLPYEMSNDEFKNHTISTMLDLYQALICLIQIINMMPSIGPIPSHC